MAKNSAGSKKNLSEKELKCLLSKCKDSIDKCVHLMPECEEKKEAENLLAETEKVLDTEFQRVILIVDEVLGKTVDVVIPEWSNKQLILLPIKKIPKEFRDSLTKGMKFNVYINIHAENVEDLIFKDFSVFS